MSSSEASSTSPGSPTRLAIGLGTGLVAVLLVAAALVLGDGDGGGDADEPTAIVSPTGPTTTDPTDSTSTPVATAASVTVSSTFTRAGDTTESSTPSDPARAVVPASTTPPSTTVEPAGPPGTAGAEDTNDSGSGDGRSAGGSGGGGISGGAVVEPPRDSTLDVADRSDAATTPRTTSTSTTTPVPCPTPGPIDLGVVGRLAAQAPGGSAAIVTFGDTENERAASIGIDSSESSADRDPANIDFLASLGASERLTIDLGEARCALRIELGGFRADVWQGHAESMHWIGLDADGRTVAEGWLAARTVDPPGGDDTTVFDLPIPAPVTRLVIEAAPYGATADGWPSGADRQPDNSGFTVVAVVAG